MTNHRIPAADLARLTQAQENDLGYWGARSELTASWPVEIDSDATRGYTYADALAVEIARQLHDNSGVPMLEALRIVAYTGAVPRFFEHAAKQPHLAKAVTDFWAAITSARNTWGKTPRGKTPVTSFGPGEYWATMHFAGSFDHVAQQIKVSMAKEGIDYPDSDTARIFWVNASAADRRLRKRAADLQIDLPAVA